MESSRRTNCIEPSKPNMGKKWPKLYLRMALYFVRITFPSLSSTAVFTDALYRMPSPRGHERLLITMVAADFPGHLNHDT
jgi:hypothetical protein